MKTLFIILICISSLAIHASDKSNRKVYYDSFNVLKFALKDSFNLSFKNAVYLVESAYYEDDNKIDTAENEIQRIALLCSNLRNQYDSVYLKEGTSKAAHAAVFKAMCDTILVRNRLDSTQDILSLHIPFTYNFGDLPGNKYWTDNFVCNLLKTNKGNCHSLSFLYKILCEELGIKAWLAIAPYHLYIKTYSSKDGWYNTELTSRNFPADSWIMASGYVGLEAIKNRVYMDTLSDKQTLSLCVLDLAKGFEKKYGMNANPDFMLRCCSLALQYYPHFIDAMLLKIEVQKMQLKILMKKNTIAKFEDLRKHPDTKPLLEDIETTAHKAHLLGYRKVPKEVYMKWLDEMAKIRGTK